MKAWQERNCNSGDIGSPSVMRKCMPQQIRHVISRGHQLMTYASGGASVRGFRVGLGGRRTGCPMVVSCRPFPAEPWPKD